VLAEAMAAGCPVVASDLKAFSDVSERGRDALLFRLGDGVDCSRAVARLLGDSHMRSMVTARGGERARCYDWKTVADRVLGIYARVLSTSVTTI